MELRIQQLEERQRRLDENQKSQWLCLCFVVISIIVVVIAVKVPHHSTSTDPPVKLYIGKGQKVAVAGKTATALLYSNDEVHDCTLGTKVMKFTICTCRLVSLESNNGDVNCTVKRKKGSRNKSEIIYTPTSPGRHQLHITVEGEHVQGSPANVTVIKKYEFPVKIIPRLSGPQGIAFSKTGEMIVAEYLGHNFRIIHSPGKNESIGSNGTGEGQFEHPTGVAVDSEGHIIVVDHKNHRIQKFNSSSGKPIKVVRKIQKLKLTLPVGVGIHPHTKMIYITTENKNHSIQIFHPNLTHYKGFGSGKRDEDDSNRPKDAASDSICNASELNQPKDVAFDSAGNVYVADNENHRIQVFTAEGEYLRMFGDRSNSEFPTGISIDENDVVYVTMLYMNCVVIFTSEGEYVTKFGSEGEGQGQLKNPRGIEINKKNGELYVSDYGNNRILVF